MRFDSSLSRLKKIVETKKFITAKREFDITFSPATIVEIMQPKTA